jgi:hypothetical protein
VSGQKKLNSASSTASLYSKIGSAISLVIGMIIVLIGLLLNQMFLMVFGFLSLICAVASYITVAEKIRTEDIAGARRWSMAFGVLLFIFGFLIGGIFFLFAHSKLSEEGPRVEPGPEPSPARWGRRLPPRLPSPPTVERLDHPVGYLEPTSGPDYERRRPRFVIDLFKTKIGRGQLGKDEQTTNDLKLDQDDTSMSRDQAWLRVDPDTDRVYMKHDPKGEKSETRVDGQPIPPGEEFELRDGSEIEFGRSGERWQFRRAAAPRSRTKPTSD